MKLIVPEVVQVSNMDCGPAALKAVAEGFGVRVSYGRLREACSTDVDGTSIDTLEDIAGQLGLQAEQVIVPIDFALLSEAALLPAIAVVRQQTNATHFVVVWRRHGPFVQVMDPAAGRLWVHHGSLQKRLHRHNMVVPAQVWREFSGSTGFVGPLRSLLSELGVRSIEVDRLVAQAMADPTWVGLAALDAAVRVTRNLVSVGGAAKGAEASRLLDRLFALGRADPATTALPAGAWSVRLADPDPAGGEQLRVAGAVLVAIGLRDPADAEIPPPPPTIIAALAAAPTAPGRELLRLFLASGWLLPVALVSGIVLGSGGVVIEGALFRGLLDIGPMLSFEQRAIGWVALLAFLLLLLLLQVPVAAVTLRIGRHLESRFRVAFLSKLPKLEDRFLHSRLISDMADRAHAVPTLRGISKLAQDFLQSTSSLISTVLGIWWVDPASVVPATVAAIASIVIPMMAQPLLAERDLRVRTHDAGLSRFYLDALLGIVPLRSHGAERSLRREHENHMVEWESASFAFLRGTMTFATLNVLVGACLSVWLVIGFVERQGALGGVLLLVYWSLNIPALGESIASTATQYPSVRNVVLRLMEPLMVPETTISEQSVDNLSSEGAGASIEMESVQVLAGGHTILDDISLKIPRGSHVAIVGSSGAGKSSLAGLLLGWFQPASGNVLVDGEPLDAHRLDALRECTAWVDPDVHIWNRSLLENLRYGTNQEHHDLPRAIRQSELVELLHRLPDGLQTFLGEGGALVSGGQGQRVRLGRALGRTDARLVILDEPFRGLDRSSRSRLLQRTRAVFERSTLLCITHDIGETQSFSRVIVVEGGRIVQDGDPRLLASLPGSRYRQMLEDEERLWAHVWGGPTWRRLTVRNGVVEEDAA